jgi:zinc transport system substrate-binding protein
MKSLKNTIFILVIVVIIVQVVMMKENSKHENSISNAPIGLSTFPLYDIAKNIAGDTQNLFMIMPFGIDSHNFEPTPLLVAKMQHSPLTIYSGAGLQPWIEDFDFENRGVDMSHYVKLKVIDASKSEHSHSHHHGDEHHEHHTHQKGYIDHHYWLDIDNMIKMAEVMTREFIVLSPKNKELYIKNKDDYIAMLEKLDKEYKTKLSECKKDTIVVNHNAFSYLSDKYGFNSDPLSGLSNDEMPDAKTMINLVKVIKEHNLSTIFYESFSSDKAIKNVASEAGVKIEILYPLGNITASQAKQDMSYEDIMRQNLEKIAQALECR